MNTAMLTTPTLVRLRDEALEASTAAQARVRQLNAALKARGIESATRTGRPSRVQHGTDSGYYYHLRQWKTEPCTPCRRAHSEAERRRRRIAQEVSA